ncbi:MAG: hypothetical protein WCW61_04845 [Patescibacteria group bacterium]|jgi:hypothetical protein
MSELGYLIKALATLSWRFNTFRGQWTDMPDSTGLCIVLGILSFASSVLAIWVEYGGAVAMAIPVVWLCALWLFATDGFSVRINKRLASAVFLLSIPAMLILALVGSGHQLIEALIGVYLSATILTLRTRE